MTTDMVLLIALLPEEVSSILSLLSRFEKEDPEEMQLRTVEVSTIADGGPFLDREDLRLVVFRVDEKRRRPEQDVRRLKRSLSRPIPLLVLIPSGFTGRVKGFLRAGADEYWILPMDSSAFPPRLQVLLEIGRDAMEGEGTAVSRKRLSSPGDGSLWRRIGHRLRRVFSGPEVEMAGRLNSQSELIAGKWRRIRRLGFGSFAEVCLVQESEGESLAVAKIPHSQKFNTKFLREAAILRELTGHPNAVQLKDVLRENGKVILIQEYAEGATLHDLMAQGMDSAGKERAYLDLLEVAACAHEHNIVHRDIKPENIVVAPSGALKLLDFGTGKDLVRRSISSTVIGSRPYMAPEQIMGKSRIASDVWALGVVLYSLATEFLPFYDENEKQLMDLILEVEPERPRNLEPEIPEELEAIILKCLQKDWNKRYASAAELKEDLLKKFPHFGSGKVLP